MITKKILIAIFCLIIPLFAWGNSTQKKPYRVYIKSGAELRSLSDNKSLVTSRGIYAKVLEVDNNKREFFIVYDRQGKPQYEVHATSIIDIEEDINILPKVHADIIYPPRSELKSENTYALFDSQLNFHIDQIQIAPLNELYQQELPSITGSRFEVRTLYVSDFLINFGLGMNYQVAYWTNEFDQGNMYILSLGPVVEYNFHQTEKWSYSLLLGGEYAPIYRIKTQESHEIFNSTLFDIGAEATWKTDYGKIIFGAHYRRHNMTLEESTKPNFQELPKDIIISSFGATIGYKYEWGL